MSDVSFSFLCPVTDDEFCHNNMKVFSGSYASSIRSDWYLNNVLTKVILRHEKRTSVCKFSHYLTADL